MFKKIATKEKLQRVKYITLCIETYTVESRILAKTSIVDLRLGFMDVRSCSQYFGTLQNVSTDSIQ